MTEEALDALGPIDYIVVEWTGQQPNGEAIPHLLELVDNGIVRILDLAFVTKAEDGTVARIEINELGAEFEVFDGASSNLLDDDDISDASTALEPGTSAAILIWENLWAAPFASALRKNGGQLVASGRIPVQALLASLEASEA
jgi:uncharacterized membrane protein